MRFFVNLNDNAVTQSLYDKGNQPSGWVTKVEASDGVQVQFHRDGVPELQPAGTPMLFGCKADGQYTSANYLTSVAVFTTPTDASGFYAAKLPTNTPTLNTALGSTDGGLTPGNLASIPTTDCEIDWWLDGATNPPAKSQTFSVEFDNTPCRGNETELDSSTPMPAAAAVQAAIVQAAAAQALLNLYAAGFFLIAPLSADFRQPRNATLTAALL